MDYKFLSAALYRAETEIDVPAGETVEIILDSVESDAKALKFAYEYTLTPSLYLSNYNPKIQIGAEIEYVREDLQNDLIFSVINRSSTENIIELRGQDFSFITLTIYNNSTSSITFSKFEVYQSQDVSPTQIANVFSEDIITSNMIKTTTVVTNGLLVDILITNALSRDAKKASEGQEVPYIQAEGIELGFYSAVLGKETEQFSITTSTAGVATTYYYWYQSIEGENAYEYITTIDPRERIPNISDSDREKFAFLVLKPSSLSKKAAFEFSYDELNNLTPAIHLGAGDENGNNKAYMYKNSNGYYNMFKQSNGNSIGIVMDDTGGYLNGFRSVLPEYCRMRKDGFVIKKLGEEARFFEYIFDENGVLTGILQEEQNIFYLYDETEKSIHDGL